MSLFRRSLKYLIGHHFLCLTLQFARKRKGRRVSCEIQEARLIDGNYKEEDRVTDKQKNVCGEAIGQFP